MHEPVALTDGVYWIGVDDRETALFEALWPLPEGVSYNAYIIKDEKTALIDTVKRGYLDDYLDKISQVCDCQAVDYLIINHMEPDHSGSIRQLLALHPELKIVGNKKTTELLAGYYGVTGNVIEVADGEELSLGKRCFKFFHTPMVHWPETMMSFEQQSGILFSGDAFGGFGALDGGVFDDEVDVSLFESETLRYFSNIVGKFSPMVQNALAKLKDLEIKSIASTHGPVWRSDPKYVFNAYDRWSRHVTEPGAVVIYGSMYANTQRMAEAVARGLALAGVKQVKVHNSAVTHISYLLSDIWRYRGLALGSCTYDVQLFPPMRHLVQMLKSKQMKGRNLGIFGSYGWSGGAVKELKEFSELSGWELVEPVVETRCAPGRDALGMCLELGEKLGRVITKG
jgi:flavorubredoxin